MHLDCRQSYSNVTVKAAYETERTAGERLSPTVDRFFTCAQNGETDVMQRQSFETIGHRGSHLLRETYFSFPSGERHRNFSFFISIILGLKKWEDAVHAH